MSVGSSVAGSSPSDASGPSGAGDSTGVDCGSQPCQRSVSSGYVIGRPPIIAGAREVPHNAILRVTPGTSAFGPCQLLKNRLAREAVALPVARTKWVLAFHDDLGFIHKQGEASIWVSTLLVHSVWETEIGEQFVATRVDSGEGRHNMTLQWMQECQQRRYPQWLSWEADAQCPALPVAKAINFNASAVERSLIFWQIHDSQVHTHTHVAGEDLGREELGEVAGGHAVALRCGSRPLADARIGGGGDRRYSNASSSVSTLGILCLLLQWACRCENKVDPPPTCRSSSSGACAMSPFRPRPSSSHTR